MGNCPEKQDVSIYLPGTEAAGSHISQEEDLARSFSKEGI